MLRNWNNSHGDAHVLLKLALNKDKSTLFKEESTSLYKSTLIIREENILRLFFFIPNLVAWFHLCEKALSGMVTSLGSGYFKEEDRRKISQINYIRLQMNFNSKLPVRRDFTAFSTVHRILQKMTKPFSKVNVVSYLDQNIIAIFCKYCFVQTIRLVFCQPSTWYNSSQYDST